MDFLQPFTTSLLASTGGEHVSIGWGMFVYSGIVLVALFTFIFLVRAGLKGRVFKNPVTQMGEQLYLFVETLCISVIGSHGRKYVPFIATLWLMIFVSNVMGLLLPHTPTADWSLNLGLALIVIFYVQYEGIKGHADHLRAKGKDVFSAWFIGFFKHL